MQFVRAGMDFPPKQVRLNTEQGNKQSLMRVVVQAEFLQKFTWFWILSVPTCKEQTYCEKNRKHTLKAPESFGEKKYFTSCLSNDIFLNPFVFVFFLVFVFQSVGTAVIEEREEQLCK